MLDQENRFDDAIAATIEEHWDVLGEQALKGVRETVNLRRIVRESVIPFRETWPEESWHQIAHLMTGSELCLAGILEFVATGRGSRGNALTLARWGFENALEAYWDAWTVWAGGNQAGGHPGVTGSTTDKDLVTLGRCPAPTPPSEWRETPPRGGEPWETLTLTLNKAKETKNKIVYGTADGSVIQSVYIDRDALGMEPPEKVKVVISEE